MCVTDHQTRCLNCMMRNMSFVHIFMIFFFSICSTFPWKTFLLNVFWRWCFAFAVFFEFCWWRVQCVFSFLCSVSDYSSWLILLSETVCLNSFHTLAVQASQRLTKSKHVTAVALCVSYTGIFLLNRSHWICCVKLLYPSLPLVLDKNIELNEMCLI